MSCMKLPHASYDDEADVLYIRFQDRIAARTEALDDLRMIDWADDGTLIGVEFVDARDGIDLHGVPAATDVELLIRDLPFPVYDGAELPPRGPARSSPHEANA